MRSSTISILIGVVVGLLSCGYDLVQYGPRDSARKTLAIETFVNNSKEPGLDVIVSDALRREFLRRGGLRLLEDPERADYVIRGEVEPLRNSARSFSSVVLALEYHLTLSLDVVIEDRSRFTPKRQRSEVEKTELYLASADIEAMRKNREEALRKLASDLAVRIHESVYERFIP